jgi:hypothetical protein
MKITVKTKDFKEALRTLNNSLKKGFTLYLEPTGNALKLWVNDTRFLNIREIRIDLISLEKEANDPWLLSLRKEQIEDLKKAVRYHREENLMIEVRKNENRDLRLPQVLDHKIIVNNKEIEIN